MNNIWAPARISKSYKSPIFSAKEFILIYLLIAFLFFIMIILSIHISASDQSVFSSRIENINHQSTRLF